MNERAWEETRAFSATFALIGSLYGVKDQRLGCEKLTAPLEKSPCILKISAIITFTQVHDIFRMSITARRASEVCLQLGWYTTTASKDEPSP